MTATAARSRFRTWAPWLILVGAVLVITYLFGSRPDSGVPLDPSSAKPSGTKAIIETLRVLGADVSVDSTPPASGVTTALLLVDDLSGVDRDAVEQWVRAGGTLVLTDPTSPLNPAEATGTAAIAFIDPELLRQCDVPALSGVNKVIAPGAVLMEVPAGSTGCFYRGETAWLVVTPVGQGTIVSIGGPLFLTNGQLGKADNAALAAAVLTSSPASKVSMLEPPPPGGGSKSLTDLIPERVKLALLQLAVAFLIVVLWRARRLGRPVVEHQPVKLAGSELVLAVGNLMQRAKGREQAAVILRGDLRRNLSERLGLPLDLPVEQLADAAAARAGLPPERLRQALTGAPPHDERELVVLAQLIESIRQEVTSASSNRRPVTTASAAT
ncbi:MAG TPA: DUF4350 domain-containing protein [Acidimicrobiales bacterium]|nr:DUF4350 domain-containing protein [Acidimicrobiales bacterium]